MVIGLQLIAIFFSLCMIYFAYISFKKSDLSITEFLIWLAAWIFVFASATFPDVLRSFAQNFLISRLLDLLVTGGFVLVLIMVSIVYLKTRKLENKLDEIVRKVAIKNAVKK